MCPGFLRHQSWLGPRGRAPYDRASLSKPNPAETAPSPAQPQGCACCRRPLARVVTLPPGCWLLGTVQLRRSRDFFPASPEQAGCSSPASPYCAMILTTGLLETQGLFASLGPFLWLIPSQQATEATQLLGPCWGLPSSAQNGQGSRQDAVTPDKGHSPQWHWAQSPQIPAEGHAQDPSPLLRSQILRVPPAGARPPHLVGRHVRGHCWWPDSGDRGCKASRPGPHPALEGGDSEGGAPPRPGPQLSSPISPPPRATKHSQAVTRPSQCPPCSGSILSY